MTYVPPKGPTEMWFVAHTGSPGCGHVLSIDFERCLVMLPEQDTMLEPEWERLHMPLPNDYVMPPKLVAPPPPPPPPPPSPIVDIPEDVELAGTAFVMPAVTTPPPSGSVHHPTRCSTPDAAPLSEKRPDRHHNILTDGIILKSVDVYGPRWRHIARMLGDREKGWSDDIVRNRYLRICAALGVEPARSMDAAYPRKRKSPAPRARVQRWTDEEDDILREQLEGRTKAVVRNDWKSISAAIGVQRTPHATRNRAGRLGLSYTEL